MIRFLIIWPFLFYLCEVNAQLFGNKDLAVHQGYMNFHAKSLNNPSSRNTRISMLTEIDRNRHLKSLFSLNYGIGMGNFSNPDTMFRSYENTNFFRLKFGILLHLPQQYTSRNWSPRKLNLYFKAGYNLDITDRFYGQKMNSRLSSSLKLGTGMVYRISHYLGLQFEISHNQRLNPDYRTFYQYSAGLIVNLDRPYIDR